jgi:hypothetical protein
MVHPGGQRLEYQGLAAIALGQHKLAGLQEPVEHLPSRDAVIACWHHAEIPVLGKDFLHLSRYARARSDMLEVARVKIDGHDAPPMTAN